MPEHGIVAGQRVRPEKADRARQFRQEPTPEEDFLWQRLRRGQLDGLHFRRQQVIDGFIVDFYCHQADLIVELDGNQHRGPDSYDEERDRILGARGLRILRIANVDVRVNIEQVVERIREAVGAYLTPNPLP